MFYFWAEMQRTQFRRGNAGILMTHVSPSLLSQIITVCSLLILLKET